MLEVVEQKLAPGYVALFATVGGSGIRIDEARHLEPTDIEMTAAGLAFLNVTTKADWQPKSYRCRRIPISTATAKAALTFVQLRESVRLDDKSVWTAVRKVREDLGLPKFGIHEFRRAWASAMHSKGATIKQVSVWLGHSTIQVTERYIRTYATEATGHEFLPL